MFRINEFKSKLDSYGGPQRLNIFTVELFGSNSNYINSADIKFFCKTVQLPGINLNTMPYSPTGFGLQQMMPMGMTPDTFNAVFIMDSNHNILSFFHDWMQAIYNFDYSNGSLAPSYRDEDHLPYELGYKSEYALNMLIRVYSYHDELTYYDYLLTDVFPTQLGSIDLSWDTNDSYATLPVNFSFSSIKVSGTGTGKIENDRTRGFGMLDFIIEASQYGQTITSLRKPNSIQDAINQYTSIKKSGSDFFSSLKNIL